MKTTKRIVDGLCGGSVVTGRMVTLATIFGVSACALLSYEIKHRESGATWSYAITSAVLLTVGVALMVIGTLLAVRNKGAGLRAKSAPAETVQTGRTIGILKRPCSDARPGIAEVCNDTTVVSSAPASKGTEK